MLQTFWKNCGERYDAQDDETSRQFLKAKNERIALHAVQI